MIDKYLESSMMPYRLGGVLLEAMGSLGFILAQKSETAFRYRGH